MVKILTLYTLGTVVRCFIILILATIATATKGSEREPMDFRFNSLPICDEAKIINHYRIDAPPSCDGLKPEEARFFKGDIFSPPPTQKLVEATACTIRKDSASYTKYFFGAESTQDEATTFSAPSRIDCMRWHRQRMSKFGRLQQSKQDKNSYNTNNRLIPAHTWHGTTHKAVKNALWTETTLAFHVLSGTAQHVVDNIGLCNTDEGWCNSDRFVYVFTPFNLTCVNTRTAIKRNTTVLYQTSEASKFFQIPDVDIAFTSLVACPESTRRCYPGYTFLRCTLASYVIASNDEAAETILESKPAEQTKPIRTEGRFELTLAQSMSSLAIKLDHEIDTLRTEMIRFACLSTRTQLINIKAAKHITPSAVLSTLLKRQSYATIGISTIQEISCVNVTAVLQPSLWIGQRFSARPIFSITFNQEEELAQWTREGYLRHGLQEFMPPDEGHTIFEINGETIIFSNGTIMEHGAPLVKAVGINIEIAQLDRERPDPTLFMERISFTPSPLSLDYLHRAFQSLYVINKAQLTAYGIDSKEISEFTNNPSYSVTTPNILELITARINPSPSLAWTIYSWASKVWTTAATLGLIYIGLALIIRTSRKLVCLPTKYTDVPKNTAGTQV